MSSKPEEAPDRKLVLIEFSLLEKDILDAEKTIERSKRKLKRLEQKNPWLGNVRGLIKRKGAEEPVSSDSSEKKAAKKRKLDPVETERMQYQEAPKPKFSEPEREAYKKMSQEKNRLLQRARAGKDNTAEETERLVREAAFLNSQFSTVDNEKLAAAAGLDVNIFPVWRMEVYRNKGLAV